MTIDWRNDRRSNLILRNADLYRDDLDYRAMVDHTVFLTDEQKEKSQLEVDRVYGFDVTRDDPAYRRWNEDADGA